MLDAIHADFHMHEDLYARLLDESNPAVTFQLLDLDNFGLSDDLYIKMNARGKPLTEFETFKARFEQQLEELFGDENTEIEGEVLSISRFFSRRIDTTWADFFWEYRDRESHTSDDAVMNLFRAVILVTRNPRKSQFVKDIPSLQNEFLPSTFTVFKNKEWLDKTFAKSLILLLETWNGAGGRLALQLPSAEYFDETAIIQKITKSATALDYSEVVQFSAYLFFLKKHEDRRGFQDWMRIVFNLSSNTLYNRPSDLRSSIAGLKKTVPHAKVILNCLANEEKPLVGFNRQQIHEEILKATLMLAHP